MIPPSKNLQLSVAMPGLNPVYYAVYDQEESPHMQHEPRSGTARRKYEYLRPGQDGAPIVTVRLNPEAHSWLKSRPEGARTCLERLLVRDKTETLAAAPEQASPLAADVDQAELDREHGSLATRKASQLAQSVAK